MDKPNSTVKVEVPDAKAAQDYQKTKIGQDTGTYDKNTNSCLTHACDVLWESGVDVPTNAKDQRRFLRELEKN